MGTGSEHLYSIAAAISHLARLCNYLVDVITDVLLSALATYPSRPAYI